MASDNLSSGKQDSTGNGPPTPIVVILATGGTIAGVGESGAHAAYSSGQLDTSQLLASVPQLAQLARLESEEVASVGSQDMNTSIWLQLARRARHHLARDEVAGVVITHGTDTLEETAYFLEEVLPYGAPVILTGAMRPATGISADGPRNLFDSVTVAVHPEARDRGVLVVVDEAIHSARGVTKTNTTYVSTFRSHDRGLVGSVIGGRALFLRPPLPKMGAELAFDLDAADELPAVHILYAYAGMNPAMISSAIDVGVRGLVLAGVGNGNASREVIAELAQAVRSGIPVVRSTRTGSGLVSRNVEVDDDALGFVTGGDLHPVKARVQLQLCIASGVPLRELQQHFL
ncbi:MAG: L-asparaginase [Planctomycetota bacterium]|jgi:L-asparaginase